MNKNCLLGLKFVRFKELDWNNFKLRDMNNLDLFPNLNGNLREPERPVMLVNEELINVKI